MLAFVGMERAMRRAWVLAAIIVMMGCGRGSEVEPASDLVTDASDETGLPDSGPDTSEVCTPVCHNRWCGQTDECGGRCTTCPENAVCNTTTWVCECQGTWCGYICCPPGRRCGADGGCEDCVADCSDKECGDDGCGGSCGMCPAGYECVDGTCHGCTAQCTGRECGDDGCGGSCGSCPVTHVCNDAGACERACYRKGFQGTVVEASWKPMTFLYGSGGNFIYTEETSVEAPFSQLVIMFRQYSTYKGPTEPGTYAIPHKGFAECSICILVFENCTAQECGRVYLADEGSVEVHSLDDANAPFEATLHDVVLKEVKIGSDFSTTWVPNGKTWCLDGHRAAATTVTLKVPQPECVPGGTGPYLDDNIANFSLTNCNNESVWLHDFCGQTKAVWIIMAVAWCPHCAKLVPQAAQYYEAHKPAVEVWVVLGEDFSGDTPDQSECITYADGRGFPRERMFYDPGWQKLTQYVYPHYMSGVPYSIILDGDNMAYVWSSAYPGSEASVLNKLIND